MNCLTVTNIAVTFSLQAPKSVKVEYAFRIYGRFIILLSAVYVSGISLGDLHVGQVMNDRGVKCSV